MILKVPSNPNRSIILPKIHDPTPQQLLSQQYGGIEGKLSTMPGTWTNFKLQIRHSQLPFEANFKEMLKNSVAED